MFFLGKLFVVYKVYTDSPEDTEKVCGALRNVKTGEFKDLKREPVGFGIEVIKAGYLLLEKQDELVPMLEEEIKAIEGVAQIENETMTLI